LTAYRLEFLGENLFYAVWVASLAAFIGNNAVLYAIVQADDEHRGLKKD
jgi:hypothetical protein